jgi:hypothetical protein
LIDREREMGTYTKVTLLGDGGGGSEGGGCEAEGAEEEGGELHGCWKDGSQRVVDVTWQGRRPWAGGWSDLLGFISMNCVDGPRWRIARARG